MVKKPLFAVLFLLTFPLLIVQMLPVTAWDYTDEVTPNNKNFEKFGPRADKLLIKLYEDAEAEWEALAAGELDMTDWPLTKPYYEKFTTPPENTYIETMYSGSECGIFLLDINWNDNAYLGNPPDPAYPNPVCPNPCSNLNFRKAIWYMHNMTTWLPEIIGTGFATILYGVVPPCQGLGIANPYPYSPAAAIAELEKDVFPADGMPDFPWDDANVNGERDPGEVFWDFNGNGVNDGGGEQVCLIFVIRTDHVHRMSLGNKLITSLNSIGIYVEPSYGPVAHAINVWFYGKAAHLYTAGWSLGPNPDHLLIWNSQFYRHPGICHNTAFVNDATLDSVSWAVRTAKNRIDAIGNCTNFQNSFGAVAAAVPWFSYSSTYAVCRTYTGPEDGYWGNYWDGIVNMPGYGPDNFFSFLNMHPRGYPSGCGDMAIRYGFSTPEIKSFNPIYATREHEWQILGLIYDTLLKRNPYTLEPMPWLASDYEVGLYDHPFYGTCSKVKFTLRSDVFWADDKQLTTADVHFTFVELDDILRARGLPPPWWYPNIMNILDFKICDAYNFEVLFDVKSIFVADWLGDEIELGYHKWPSGTPILPKQIWKPLAETGPVDSMTVDPNMIGCGPWRFVEYVAYSHVLMVANKPDSTVTTNHEGSTPVTSTMGYFRCQPFQALNYLQYPTPYRYKLQNGTEAQLGTTLYNEQCGAPMVGDWTADLTLDEEPIAHEEGGIDLPPAEPCNAHSMDIEIYMSSWACGMVRSWGYWHRLTPEEEGPPYLYKIHKEFWGTAKAGVIIRIILSLDDVKIVIFEFTTTVRRTWKIIIRFHVTSPIKVGKYCVPYEFSKCTRYWFTMKGDISGSTFYDDIDEPCPHKAQLPTPDFKLDIRDISPVARAFGSYPGHPRWSTVADINDDYKIDIKDIASIARKYGWMCTD